MCLWSVCRYALCYCRLIIINKFTESYALLHIFTFECRWALRDHNSVFVVCHNITFSFASLLPSNEQQRKKYANQIRTHIKIIRIPVPLSFTTINQQFNRISKKLEKKLTNFLFISFEIHFCNHYLSKK